MIEVKKLQIALDTEEKIDTVEKIKLKPKNKDYYARLARLCAKEGNLKDAEKALKFGLSAIPSDRRLMEQLAQLYVDMGKTRQAIDVLNSVLRRYPTESWSAYGKLARLYKKQGEFEKAVQVFESIGPDNPFRERAFASLFILFFVMQDHTRGIKNLKQAIKEFGVNHRRAKDLGRLYMKKNNKKQAVKWLKKALQHKPDDMDARILIGLAYFDAKEYRNARMTFNKVLKLKRGSYPALINLAELSLLQGRLEEAKKILLKIRRKDPWDSRHKVGLGEYWLKKERPKIALRYAEQGLKETPFYYPLELVRAHDIVGKACAALGNETRATVHEAIRSKLAAGVDPFDAMMELAKQYQKEKKPALAEEVLGQLLATFPGNALALVEMAQARFSRGMAESAVDLCREALKDQGSRFVKDRISALNLMAQIYHDLGKHGLARDQEKLAAELEQSVRR